MALIHEYSSECVTSPLELFTLPPTQTVVDKTFDVEYQPLTSLKEDTPVEFLIPASTEEYLDLRNSRLYFKIKITNADDTALAANAKVATINDPFNGWWSNAEMFMNGRLISHSNNTHGYTSIISHLIHDSEESMHSERSMRLIYKDTAGAMDSFNPLLLNRQELVHGFNLKDDGTALDAQGNVGLRYRFCYTAQSNPVTLAGCPRFDMFEQERYIPPGVSIKLRFHRQKASYVLMANSSAAFRLHLTDCYLMMRKVKVSPGVALGHADALKHSNAKYPITRKECKVLAIPTGFNSFVKDNIFLGQLPKRVVIGMVDNTAFSGNSQRNPYNFQHFNVNYMQLYVEGDPVLSKPLQPEMSTHSNLRCYESLYKAFDKVDGDKSHIIKREDWDKGYSLYAFDLTPDYDGGDRYSLIKHGNLRLEINFGVALSNPINIIVYAEFDNILEISEERNVIYDYT